MHRKDKQSCNRGHGRGSQQLHGVPEVGLAHNFFLELPDSLRSTISPVLVQYGLLIITFRVLVAQLDTPSQIPGAHCDLKKANQKEGAYFIQLWLGRPAYTHSTGRGGMELPSESSEP